MPRRQRSRATVCAHGEPGTSSAMPASSASRRIDQRVDRAEVVQQRDLRAALAEVDRGQPGAVAVPSTRSAASS